MLGVVEEVAEFMDSRDANMPTGMIDSLGDQSIYALNLCLTVGARFPEDTRELVRKVSTDQLVKMVGHGCRGILKKSQGIRGVDDKRVKENIELFAETWRQWAEWQVRMYALPPLLTITNDVWDMVSQRNWKANPATGR
jgi:hypothetical protein